MGKESYFLGTDHGIATRIGAFTSIAGGVYIHGPDNHACIVNRDIGTTFDFGKWGVPYTRSGWSRGDVEIGNDVWIGEGAQILSGVKIGDGVIIGAHTVIGKNVPPYAVIVGNPYQIKRYRYSPEIIKKMLKIKWWEWDNQDIKNAIMDLMDINVFVEKYG